MSEIPSALDNLNSLPIIGQIVTFGSKSGSTKKHSDVVQALKDSGLDEKEARTFLPQNAFSRACRKLREERVIDEWKEEGDIITFQFTKKAKKESGIEFSVEAFVKLDKSSGKIDCNNPELMVYAQSELDRCMEERTTNDVTQIVNRLFTKEAELCPIPGAIGVFFVSREHVPFVSKIESFLARLGRRPYAIPIPSGTAGGDKMAQDAVAETMSECIKKHQEAIEGFSLSTRQGTLEATAERINHTRIKIEAYASYLSERRQELLDAVEDANHKLMEQINRLSGEREANPETKGEEKGFDRFDCLLGSVPARINACLNGVPKQAEGLAQETGVDVLSVKIHLRYGENRGIFSRSEEGFTIKE